MASASAGVRVRLEGGSPGFQRRTRPSQPHGRGADDATCSCHRAPRSAGGGLVAVSAGEILAELPLPLAGLITDQPLEVVKDALDALDLAAESLGNRLTSPFMALSFLGLPVIPSLRLTDMGLVDVESGRLVPLQS